MDVVKELLGIRPDAFVVLTNHETGEVRIIPGRNLVTNAGDEWYAQSACGEPVTNDFTSLYLATGGPSPVLKTTNAGGFAGITGEKAATLTYPLTDDADPDNAGAGIDIVSWLFEYSTLDGPFVAITHSFISVAGVVGAEPILNGYEWGAPWDKDGSTSAKIFANHEMLGA